ncbi:MAG TPA: hypothetical protein VK153_01800 [Candidatus Paceibacterota bacterium]|nr:hypothetical protein [Candidatus Paceibacterota bacterium]
MDPDLKNLLEENLKLNQENNGLLKKIYSIERWRQITRALYWVVIIGVSFGAFYYIKPFLGNLLNVYSGGSMSGIENLNQITKNLSEKEQIQNLLKTINE